MTNPAPQPKPSVPAARQRGSLGFRRTLLASAAIILAPGAGVALAQSCTVSNGACTISAGTYTQSFSDVSSASSLNATNNGSFSVTTQSSASFLGVLQFQMQGANGPSSSDGDAGDGGAGGALTVTNNGTISHSISTILDNQNTVVTLSAYSVGGNGGNYTNSNNKDDAGRAGSSGTVALTNIASISVFTFSASGAGLPAVIQSGAAVMVDSRGGAGGSQSSDSVDDYGIPKYNGDGRGENGGAAANVSLTNSGNVTVGLYTNAANLLVAGGYWGVGARSLGGNAGNGTNGPDGDPGAQATLNNTGNVSVAFGWGASSPGTATSPVTPGGFAVIAMSQGGNGTPATNSDSDGGNGGSAGNALVTVGDPNNARSYALTTYNPNNLTTTPRSAVIGAISQGGNGQYGYSGPSVGGSGGFGSLASVTVQDRVTITAEGDRTLGILALSQGGRGGDSGPNRSNGAMAGPGGNTGNPGDTTNNAYVKLTNTVISTTGLLSAGVMAMTQGGDGGTGSDVTDTFDFNARGGGGGAGGNGGPVQVEITGGSITTTGAQSPGLVAMAQGGLGGRGGNIDALGGGAGNAGAGGSAAAVNVSISNMTIRTSGDAAADRSNPAYGVLAASIGGAGGGGGSLNADFGGASGAGGAGGNASGVTVNVTGGSITTQGTAASAIAAISQGGNGGNADAYNASGFISLGANGGNAGNSGAVSVTNSASLTTSGIAAHGIFALSRSGISGNGSSGDGVGSTGGDAGASGITGSASVTHNGNISTSGDYAFGILVQSIGGGTGAGGSNSGSLIGLGGDSTNAANASSAYFNQRGGAVTTQGAYAIGMLAQSIGGGGGNGGDGSSAILSLGGSGGGGGNAGTAYGEQYLGNNTTLGRLAHGMVVQSIGGGGGNGGDANASGSAVTLTIGGTGGAGGSSGEVTARATYGSLSTSGTNAIGIVAQSIAGGGGTGGSAYSLTAGASLSAALAVGGSGGAGGNAAPLSVALVQQAISTGLSTRSGTNQNPVDSFGVLAQVIGGGGGAGGSSMARAFAAALPVPGLSGAAVAGSVSASVGGDGGRTGTLGTLTFTMDSASSITTQGQGSHGVVLQSIGGGGGVGGDSSAMATTAAFGRAATQAETDSFTMELSLGLGGTGANGGSGGQINASITGSSITTYGDYANGLVAQSVGGGGGNAGYGSSTTQGFGSTRVLHANIGVGGQSSDGGSGGNISITTDATTLIQTFGASAVGMLAQSIGGGGGSAQGGTINLGGTYTISSSGVPFTVTPSADLGLTVGGKGGAGGNGGSVTVVMGGQIRTSGSDSPGLLLQSIGGGGGIGGSAGAEASSDNPYDPIIGGREIISDIVNKDVPLPISNTTTIGARNGADGGGGVVNFTQNGTITTQNDWSHGVFAQSLGGGGGVGGAATSNSSLLGMSTTIVLGSQSGASGNGGVLTLNFSPGSQITTGQAVSGRVTGYGAFGVLAQGIGGGGGQGLDGSPVPGSVYADLGASGNGSSGSAGDGGVITVNGSPSIVTRGDYGMGMVLQSIGAGGGVVGTGNSLSAGAGSYTGITQLWVGGSQNATGNGKDVTTSTSLAVNIQTAGANAIGMLAQSIGGGGGLAFASGQSSVVAYALGPRDANGAAGNGGIVTLNFASGSITTSGRGAHGVVAQSIGGSGGIAGLPTAGSAATLSTTPGNAGANGNGRGSGATVTINSNAAITTTGDFAHGILAQSIGGGGGLYTFGNQLLAGSTGLAGYSSGSGGAVNVTVSQPILATGVNSVGVFAQSQSAGGGGTNPATVIANASITGGSGAQGQAIWVDSSNGASSITVGAGATISALSGHAITMTAGSVTNSGTVNGTYTLGGGGGFLNTGGGTLNAGAFLVAPRLENAGTLRIAAHVTHGVSAVSGDFVQRGSGRLLFDADFTNRRADVMTVAGAADLAGQVRPLITSVLPNVELRFLSVAGPVTGTLEGAQTEIFRYAVSRKGGDFAVSANADFTPAGYSLSRNIAAVANHMQAAWDAGGSGLGPLFATLGNIADRGGEGAYSAALRQISPSASLAPGARLTAGARAFANAALSCPQFEGTTAMLREGECVWATLTGRTAAQSGVEGLSSFRYNAMLLQAGGQRAIGGGWFLGGSLAYENSRLSTTDGLNSGRGQAGYAAVTAKYQTGPWLFSGALFGGAGEFNSTRTITLPGFGSIARGSPTLSNVGGLLRATYTLGGEEFYLRPSLTMSLIHARSSAWRESGAGVLNLEVSGASSTVGALTPALEVGGRVNFANGVVMRLFTTGGVSLLSSGQWSQESRLVSAPSSARFESTVRTDQVVGRLAVGAQVFATDRLEVRLQYEGEYSANLTGHGGSLSLAYRF
ncbi:hypothetical protein KTR66_07060 [Roseococcus sp. SDR]|uniref:autotransporter outer membrane beta-barrel domain-containing protein n=1 Tax=Roseococcus sp. SDR TaxID=2835532 RepID=UPI001BCEE17B|nr:autotransporter outer membrane beta-barrel domain-containing protein [Roseococcus sp. SDR]MBS7789746.1 hypothetical protein [Roseococcus sp. SDR]MBV1845060.1 hypothetical protein [Roseococcus sp. SDR]